MAKKKQKKRSGPGRAGAGASTTTANRHASRVQAAADAERAVKPSPATPDGPNRLERKEAARLARERMRRKAARKKTYRRAAIGAVVAVVIGGIVFLSTRP